MKGYQKLLLEKLEDNLKNIKMECYLDEDFEDVIIHKVLDRDIDYVIDNLREALY